MNDHETIARELDKLEDEGRYRYENWGGAGYRGADEIRGFKRALRWVLHPESELTHPPSGWLSLRDRGERE